MLREIAHEGEERRLIWQLLAEALYGDDHPLRGRSSGPPRREALTLEDLASRARGSVRRRVALAAVGCVSADAVAALAERLGCRRRAGRSDAAPGLPAPGRRHVERRSDLLHVAVGWRFGGSPTRGCRRCGWPRSSSPTGRGRGCTAGCGPSAGWPTGSRRSSSPTATPATCPP